MARSRSSLVVVCAAFLMTVVSTGDARRRLGHPDVGGIGNEVIVKPRKSMPPGELAFIQTSVHATVKARFDVIGAELWELNGMTAAEAVKYFKDDPHIEYIEPNYIVRTQGRMTNDPRIAELWGLHNTGQTGGKPDADIDAPEAWDVATGDGVLVGIIDTGVDWRHPDLVSNIYTNLGEIPGNGLDDDGNGFVDDIHGWDFRNNDNDPSDDNGHGTHVAGTVAAAGDNAIGIAGVSWSARILPIKFLGSSGTGSTADAVQAILYATRMGARVTNNSWGGGSFSQALRDAIAFADAAGALFVTSAGGGRNNDVSPSYPTGYDLDNIIAVAATNHYDVLLPNSGYGPTTVDLAAPGGFILSTWPGGSYRSLSGTSMASPHVAGAACLVWSADPSLTHTDVKAGILAGVDPLPTLAGKTLSGGRLNVYDALVGPDTTPPARVDDLDVVLAGPNSLTLEWTASGDDGTEGTASAYDIRYSESFIYWSNFDSATPVSSPPSPQPSGSTETFEVGGLKSGTTYYFAMTAIDDAGNTSWMSNIVEGTTSAVLSLYPAQPNPFNPTTTIRYDLRQAAAVHLAIYNIKGEKVKELVNGTQPAGSHSVRWNGDNASGEPVASGVYFYTIKAGSFARTNKLILLK